MLRLNVLTTVIPVASLLLVAQQSIGWASRPCIVAGEASVELAALPWTADLHVAFTDDPARANLRIQIVDSAEAADFALVDGVGSAEGNACGGAARQVTISAQGTVGTPLIYLSQDGPADYRVFVQSEVFSAQDAAALLAAAKLRPMHAAAL